MNGMLKAIAGRTLGGVFLLFGLVLGTAAIWASYSDGEWSYLGALLLAVPISLVGWARLFPSPFAPLLVDPDDPLMTAAIEIARREIGRFKRGLLEGKQQAFVKVPLPVGDSEREHVWALAHSLDGSELTVSIVNEPVEAPQEGDLRRKYSLSEIQDWMLVSADGETEGGYTMGAMAKIMKRDQGRVPRSLRSELERFRDVDVSDI